MRVGDQQVAVPVEGQAEGIPPRLRQFLGPPVRHADTEDAAVGGAADEITRGLNGEIFGANHRLRGEPLDGEALAGRVGGWAPVTPVTPVTPVSRVVVAQSEH